MNTQDKIQIHREPYLKTRHQAHMNERFELRRFLNSNEAIDVFDRLGLRPSIQFEEHDGSRVHNTDRCYALDQKRFRWLCVCDRSLEEVTGSESLGYFRALADAPTPRGKRRATTLYRAYFAVTKMFWENGLPSPTATPEHRALLRKVARNEIQPPRKARPLFGSDALRLFDSISGATLGGKRDRAITALGINRGWRASTIVGLMIETTEIEERGVVSTIHSDKTHDDGEIRTPTPHSDGHVACVPCTLSDYKAAMASIGLARGPLFRKIDRWGFVSDKALRPDAVTEILRRHLARAGIAKPDTYSSHSFRHGVINAAAKMRWTLDEIRRVTLHRSDRGLQPYIAAIDPWYFTPNLPSFTPLFDALCEEDDRQ